MLIGTIEPFDQTTDQWECWEERLDVYFAINSVEDENKLSVKSVNWSTIDLFSAFYFWS